LLLVDVLPFTQWVQRFCRFGSINGTDFLHSLVGRSENVAEYQGHSANEALEAVISFPATRRNQNAPIQARKEGGGSTAMVLEAKLRGGMPHAEAFP
jgi:hypothetical protein